jgi:hypothetical protein
MRALWASLRRRGECWTATECGMSLTPSTRASTPGRQEEGPSTRPPSERETWRKKCPTQTHPEYVVVVVVDWMDYQRHPSHLSFRSIRHVSRSHGRDRRIATARAVGDALYLSVSWIPRLRLRLACSACPGTAETLGQSLAWPQPASRPAPRTPQLQQPVWRRQKQSFRRQPSWRARMRLQQRRDEQPWPARGGSPCHPERSVSMKRERARQDAPGDEQCR